MFHYQFYSVQEIPPSKRSSTKTSAGIAPRAKLGPSGFTGWTRKILYEFTRTDTRALFGPGPSPFLLGGVIKKHLNHCRADDPECVDEIERELYVDDLLISGWTVEKAKQLGSSDKPPFVNINGTQM